METLIYRIANRICHGFTKAEIAEEFKDQYSQDQIFLAYKAAEMLVKDWTDTHDNDEV